MKLLFTLLLLPTLLLAQKGKVEVVKRYDYIIEVTVANSFSGIANKFILNNVDRQVSSAERKPFTLLIVTNTRFSSTADTLQIKLSRSECDSLFTLTKNFFSKLSLKNTEVLIDGQKREIEVSDDSNAKVFLQLGRKKLTAIIESISHPENTSREFNNLVKYLYKFQPKQ